MKTHRLFLFTLILFVGLAFGAAHAADDPVEIPQTNPEPTLSTPMEPTTGDAEEGKVLLGGLGGCEACCVDDCWAAMDLCVSGCFGRGFPCKLACADEKDRCLREDCGCWGAGPV